MKKIEKILKQREEKYGDYEVVSSIAQDLKEVVRDRLRDLDKELPEYMQESLDMIFNKIGRLISGDQFYPDNWIDIAGYSQLVINILEKYEEPRKYAYTTLDSLNSNGNLVDYLNLHDDD